MKSNFLIFSIFLFLFGAGCRKDVGLLPVNSIKENPPLNVEDTVNFTCVTFPVWFHPPPDSVTFPDKQIMYWQYCPGTKSEVVYTLGTQIWTYNFNTRLRYFISNNLVYLPDCNSKGWILYSDFKDLCVYKVKTNGDSLTRLTFDGSIGAHWNYTGTSIYYYCEGKNNLYKINEQGKKVDSISNVPVAFTAFSKKSDKLFFEKSVNGISSIVCLDMETKTEQVIVNNISGRMAMDDKDENIFFRSMDDPKWAVIKYNIPLKRTDTLLKNCDSYFFTWPSVSVNTNKVTIGCIFARFLDPKVDVAIKKPKILKWTKAFEMDLNDPSHKLKEVNLFP